MIVVPCIVLHVVYVLFCFSVVVVVRFSVVSHLCVVYFSVVVRFSVQIPCCVSPVSCVFQSCGQIPFFCGFCCVLVLWLCFSVVSLLCVVHFNVVVRFRVASHLCVVYFRVVVRFLSFVVLVVCWCCGCVSVLGLTSLLGISVFWSDSFHMLFLYYVDVVTVFQVFCFSVVYFSVVVRFLAQRLPHLPRDHTDNLSTYLLSLMSNPELSFTFFSCYFYFYFLV